MKVIHKYEIHIDGTSAFIPLPLGAIILTCQSQNTHYIFMWVVVDNEVQVTVSREFIVLATGFSEVKDNYQYIATVQTTTSVWHIFEVKPFNSFKS